MKESIMNATAIVVSAMVSANRLRNDEVREGILSIYNAFDSALTGGLPVKGRINPSELVKDDYVVCLEDGTKHIAMKRYLWRMFKLTPEAYREKWGLPADFPMVCKKYSEKRVSIAKNAGFGKVHWKNIVK